MGKLIGVVIACFFVPLGVLAGSKIGSWVDKKMDDEEASLQLKKAHEDEKEKRMKQLEQNVKNVGEKLDLILLQKHYDPSNHKQRR
jgi:hypothetical protein